ncbi:MAG TPA: acyl-CoA thioesterase domain-containing protein [Mycobacteriales bacterium]|nr:acyl-CoA thioesterase domain-containing protein [Mycobacteriales bacterium]
MIDPSLRYDVLTGIPTPFGLADLLTALQIDDSAERWQLPSLPSGHGGVLGSQLLAQQVTCAERLVPDKKVLTLQALFIRGGVGGEPLELYPEELQQGRSFASYALTFRQGSTTICRADVLLHADESDYVRVGLAAPDPGRIDDARPMRIALMPWETRAAAKQAPGSLLVWQRIPVDSADPSRCRSLLAFTTEVLALQHFRVAESLPPTPAVTGSILSQRVSFFDQLDLREWHLVRTEVEYAGGGRAAAGGEIYSADGRLAATFEQVALMRGGRS